MNVEKELDSCQKAGKEVMEEQKVMIVMTKMKILWKIQLPGQ